MRSLSLPVDPVSYPITTAPMVGWGLYRAPRKRWRTVVVPAWTFQRDGARAHSEVNTHVCHCSFTSKRLWQKAFLSEALKEMCIRWLKCNTIRNVQNCSFPLTVFLLDNLQCPWANGTTRCLLIGFSTSQFYLYSISSYAELFQFKTLINSICYIQDCLETQTL